MTAEEWLLGQMPQSVILWDITGVLANWTGQ